MDWPDKVKIWELHYLKETPIERIRKAVKRGGEVAPSWPTVRGVIDEFPLLTPAQVTQLPEALQARWWEKQPPRSDKGQEALSKDIGKRARLQIEFDPARLSELGLIRYTCSPLVRKFGRVSVCNIGEATALRSWGIFRIVAPKEALGKYPRDLKLHWVDTPSGLDTDSAELVDIAAGPHKLLDVVFSQPRKEDVSKLPEPMFGQILTSARPYSVIVGSMESAEWEQPVPGEGCWVADDIALANPSVTVPGYMPHEHYIVEVVVGCENGQGDTKCFQIVSPLNWRDLDMISVTPSPTA